MGLRLLPAQKACSKKKCNQPDCQKSKGWYIHKTIKLTSNDEITKQVLYAKHIRTIL